MNTRLGMPGKLSVPGRPIAPGKRIAAGKRIGLPAFLPPGLRLLAIAIPLMLAFPAFSQGIDLTQGGPIQITARDGIEWRQAEQVVIANGDAKAVRGNVTVTADRLLAWYRPKGAAAPAQPVTTGLTGATDTEGNEVYRMRAEGNVHVYTETDQAWGDQATYDLDQAVLVMTGNALKLTTPSDTLTSRDTLEYWSQKHMAVARGDAVVVTNDARRISADTLVAYTLAAQAANASGSAPPGSPSPGSTAQSQNAGRSPNPTGNPTTGSSGSPSGSPSGDPMAEMAGRVERVEAFNNVSVRTQTDTVTGERGVYVPDTGIAHLGGHVRITRGLNQVNGSEAVVNMKSGLATLLSGDSGRVSGLVIPNDQSNPAPGSGAQSKPPGDRPKPGGTP
jgi:lipopolysaccharide export system protein LptA